MLNKTINLKKRAFTLIELLVVIAVMSILIGSTVAGFSYIRQTKQAEGVAEEIKNQLMLARSTALTEGKDVSVNINGNNNVTITGSAGEIFNRDFNGFNLSNINFKYVGTDAATMGQINPKNNISIDIKRNNKVEATIKVNPISGNVEIE